ncbi:hypothetical protein TrCOL_g7595, partial [Triparma columacea]
RKLKQVAKAHDKAINTLFKGEGGQLLSAGRDGKVQFWDTSMNNTKTIDIAALLGKSCRRPVIKSVCLNDDSSKLLVGTEGSEIFEVDAASCKDLHNGALVSGHYKDELWGAASNPMKSEVATVGDDGTLRLWDLKARGLRAGESVLDLAGMARAVCYSPDGKLIAVGFGGSVGKGRQKCDGEYAVYDAETLALVHKAKDSKEWIQDLKFSPDGKTLAVGSHDNTVYFYAVDKGWKLRSKFSKHSSFITHLDFSEDSTFLKSNCGAYELLYSDVFTGNQITSASSLRDSPWATDSCILGWGQQNPPTEAGGVGASDPPAPPPPPPTPPTTEMFNSNPSRRPHSASTYAPPQKHTTYCSTFMAAVVVSTTIFASLSNIATVSNASRYPPLGKLFDVGDPENYPYFFQGIYRSRSLHLWCEGSSIDNGQPVILFEHGWMGSSMDWGLVRGPMSEFTRVCSYDRAGYGWSDQGPEPRTSEQIARETERLLEVAEDYIWEGKGRSQLLLAGHSMAGFQMRIFQDRNKDLVGGILFADAVNPDYVPGAGFGNRNHPTP